MPVDLTELEATVRAYGYAMRSLGRAEAEGIRFASLERREQAARDVETACRALARVLGLPFAAVYETGSDRVQARIFEILDGSDRRAS